MNIFEVKKIFLKPNDFPIWGQNNFILGRLKILAFFNFTSYEKINLKSHISSNFFQFQFHRMFLGTFRLAFMYINLLNKNSFTQ